MNDAKYIGLEVHQATIFAAVLDSTGKLLMESVLETKAATILHFIRGLCGSLHVTFEADTCAAWLHDLLKAHVTKVLACDTPASKVPVEPELDVGLPSVPRDYHPLADAALNAAFCCLTVSGSPAE